MNNVLNRVLNQIKFVWNKYYNLIQWTKKWHFCQTYVVAQFFYICLMLLLLPCRSTALTSDSFPIGSPMYPTSEDAFDFVIFFLTGFYEVFTVFFAFIIQFLAIIIKLIMRKKISISNKFLMENKVYNVFYVIITVLTWIIIILLIYGAATGK